MLGGFASLSLSTPHRSTVGSAISAVSRLGTWEAYYQQAQKLVDVTPNLSYSSTLRPRPEHSRLGCLLHGSRGGPTRSLQWVGIDQESLRAHSGNTRGPLDSEMRIVRLIAWISFCRRRFFEITRPLIIDNLL